ncbi:MAG: putative tRNA N6-adenosine threonylcarbamoyltransferase, mitochondrial, partial [Paramarteilia canceri]
MALICSETKTVLSEFTYCQKRHHYAVYGGINPLLAQKLHTEKLDFVMKSVLKNYSIGQVGAIAFANRPGLAHSLSSGLNFVKNISKNY